MTKRRLYYILVLLGIIVSRGIAGPDSGSQPSERPNIILLLTDDQRNDTLGCAGHPIVLTPHIDHLSEQGVRFDNCFVTTSICAASRASILTGLYERTHGYTFGKSPVPRNYTEASYPALLRRAGYRCGFFGKYGCRMEGSEKLFDVFEKVKGPGYQGQPDGSQKESTEVIGDLAEQFIRDKDGRPFCLSISFHAAHAKDSNLSPGKGHYPYPLRTSNLYTDVTIPPPNLNAAEYFDSLPPFMQQSMNRKRYFWRWDTPEKYQTNMRAYYRMISGIDTVVGQLQQVLHEQQLADNTVIIYTADNGYYMGDRGFAGKWSHFEQSLRVPLIINDPRMPKQARGRVVASMALNIDLAPTILDFAGLSIPSHYQGRSLTPFLTESRDLPWRSEIFCEHLMNHPDIPKWEGMRTERYKYARYFQQEPVYEFLHDLEKDPTERDNLVSDPNYRDVLKEMRSKVQGFFQKALEQ